MERYFKVNAPSVVSEVIDGEAVIVNLLTGHYFSTGRSGSVLWEWIGQGASDGAVARALAARYDVDLASASTAVDAFLTELLGHELILEHLAEWSAPHFEPGAGEGRTTMPDDWSPPTLEVYSDMQDLLLLDPIHDVDEAGWPMAKPPTTPVA